MKAALKAARLAASSDAIVLLLGESGSGKDTLARLIHDWSHRKGRPFLSVDCSVLSAELFESELFGHERGAFTGAWEKKRGLIEIADGGTLLLNEIGDMPMPLQSKLLAFLDTYSFRRVGGTDLIRANVRIIAATNQDLPGMVAAKTFRSDLFFRLRVITIRVPALRDRTEDISGLTQALLTDLLKKEPSQSVPDLYPQTLTAMIRYPWPGNVRELKNVLESCLVNSGSRTKEMNVLLMKEICDTAVSAPIPFVENDTPPIIAELLQQAGDKRVRNPSFRQKNRLYQECIVERAWHQKDIARALDVSEAAVSDWLRDVKRNLETDLISR
jgi:transcriptional regulator with PAS, ATPase and Fis domain